MHTELDIRSKKAVIKYIKSKKPDLIMHCAALTGIRVCEENMELAWQTNVEGTKNLVSACERYADRILFVYVSTACVFHGDRGDYVETDLPYPKNFYSLTKLLGEEVVLRCSLEHLVIRTNFVARERWPYPAAFVDRYGTYLFSEDVAKAIRTIMGYGLTGTVHVCGEEKMSMYDLARITTPDIKPMTLSQYQGPPLTVDMSLRSIRIKPFRITKRLVVSQRTPTTQI